MPIARAGESVRDQTLAALGRELASLPGGGRLRLRRGRTWRGVAYLRVRGRGRLRGLRVYCVTSGAAAALVTSRGELVVLTGGLAAAAARIAASCGQTVTVPAEASPAAARQPGTLSGRASCQPGRCPRPGPGRAAARAGGLAGDRGRLHHQDGRWPARMGAAAHGGWPAGCGTGSPARC